MSDAFREMFEGLKETANALILANAGLKKTADAALQVKDDYQDLRETVHRLESFAIQHGERAVEAEQRALEHGRDLKALREQIRILQERLNGR